MLETAVIVGLVACLVLGSAGRWKVRLRRWWVRFRPTANRGGFRPTVIRGDFRPAVKRGGERPAPGAAIAARVARVIDGDTVDVVTGDGMIRVRLACIDCPEDGQDWGDTATHGLIKLIGGKTVRLECYGLDPYGRTLATLYVARDGGGQWLNVNERMVALGHAWVMRRFYNHLPMNRQDALNRIENWARTKRVGLWKTGDPIPPWEWRAANAKE